MKRKAQSALEYMMTYGWAILIIVIVATILYSMGVFTPSSSTPTTATGFTPFTVLAQACNANGLQVQFGNNAGQTVNVTKATVTTQTGLSAGGSLYFGIGGSYATPISGGSFIVNGSTGVDCTTPGARYSATIELTYNQTNAIGTQQLTATGTVAGTASS